VGHESQHVQPGQVGERLWDLGSVSSQQGYVAGISDSLAVRMARVPGEAQELCGCPVDGEQFIAPSFRGQTDLAVWRGILSEAFDHFPERDYSSLASG
jgi:hypothetical protein